MDNAPAARPQTGLDQANLIYEVPAEGGITRYIAFFDSAHPKVIGPIRSTRVTFNWIVKGYGVPLAHAGGNVDALNALKPLNIPNLDAIYTAGGDFYRAKNRKEPHNLYASFDTLMNTVKKRGMPHPNLPTLPIGTNGPAPSISTVTIPYFRNPPIYSYTVSWKWENGAFYRYINGKPDKMSDGVQQHVKNLIVVKAPMVSDAQGSPNTVGATKFQLHSGQGFAFMDGAVYPLTWTFNNYRFSYQVNGSPLKYTQGRVFVELVPTGISVNIK